MIQESAGISFGIEHADEVIQVFQRSRCPDSAFLRRSPLEVRNGSFLRYRRHLLQDDSLHHAAGQTCSANVNLLSSSSNESVSFRYTDPASNCSVIRNAVSLVSR